MTYLSAVEEIAELGLPDGQNIGSLPAHTVFELCQPKLNQQTTTTVLARTPRTANSLREPKC